MQLIPRYLVDNKTTILVSDTGHLTEYRPVYTKQLKIYRGIDNVLQFKLLNADQKAKSLTGKTPKFVCFDDNKNLVIEHNGTVHSTIKGLFTITISENDMLNLPDQFLSYSIHLEDNTTSAKTLTYSDTHFVNNGTIQISSEVYPTLIDSKSISNFTESGVGTGIYFSDSISAEPGINGNEALHTAVIYTSSYVGDVVVQATLDNTITGSTTYADLATLTFTGTETTPTPVNFNGVLGHVRFKTSADPASKISKILVRN
tara:strand:- start:36 stop:812 length:777 start_codon:yes stop_codon:yes gene_type:complete